MFASDCEFMHEGMDTVTSSSQLKLPSSSEQVVLNQDEGLLTVLFRVSRQWNSLITNPHFTHLRNLLPLSASDPFIQRSNILDVDRACPSKVLLVALDDDDSDTPSSFRTLTFAHDPCDPRRVLILRSCNGLLLCSTCLIAPPQQLKCFIYNPSTNQLAILLKHPSGTRFYYIGLAFDPLKSHHYKVIAHVITSLTASVGDFRVIKKSTCSSQIKHSSCAQEVVLNQDEDLLTLILIRLPCQKLMTLKYVSRLWHSIITAPHFTRLRPLRASGLFIQTPLLYRIRHPTPYKVYFVPLDDPGTPPPFRTLTIAHDPFDPENIRIRQSCNGLLLCSTNGNAPLDQCNCYVYNPSTNQLATLPEHPDFSIVALAFDPLKSPHYKVIAFSFRYLPVPDTSADIYIYSSETGTWRLSVQSVFLAKDFHLTSGVYWNGSVHWLSEKHMDYYPGWAVPDGLYFNVDEGRVETLPRLPMSGEKATERSWYFGESEDHLHYIEVCPYATSFSVYEMKSDYSEWFVKYQIDLAPISKVFPEMTNHNAHFNGGNNNAVGVLSLIRREKFQEDSFLVLEIPGKAIRYNLEDRSFKVIWDFTLDFGLDSLDKVHSWPFGMLKVSQYIETLSCV